MPLTNAFNVFSSPDVEVEEESEDEDKPKTKKIDKTTWDWRLMNENKPIWTRT